MTLGKWLDPILCPPSPFVSKALHILESRGWGDGLVASLPCDSEIYHQSQWKRSWCVELTYYPNIGEAETGRSLGPT